MKFPYVSSDQTYDRKEVVECLTSKESLSNKKGGFTNRDFVSVEFKLVHHIVTHCLFPRNGGHDAVSIQECVLIYCIIYNLEYDLVDAMLSYMFNQKDRANGHLPYAMYLTRLFLHFKIDLSDDVLTCPSSYNEINVGTLQRMRYIKHDDGKWKMISAAPGDSEEDIPPESQTAAKAEDNHEEDEEDIFHDVLGDTQGLGNEEGSQGKVGKDPQAGVDSADTVSDLQPTLAPTIPTPNIPLVTTSSSSSLLSVSTLQALLASSLGSLKADLQSYIREQIQASTSTDQTDSSKKTQPSSSQ